MIYAVVGGALLVLGAVAGSLSRKAGTILAVILVVAWIGLLSWFGLSGSLDGPTVQSLAAYLVIGLLAFLAGSNLTSRIGASRRTSSNAD